jgi:hypothetical protein
MNKENARAHRAIRRHIFGIDQKTLNFHDMPNLHVRFFENLDNVLPTQLYLLDNVLRAGAIDR